MRVTELRIAVTGVKDPMDPEAARALVRRTFAAMPEPPEMVVTGAQFGIDTIAFEEAVALWPGETTLHRIVVPGARHNNDVVALARKLSKRHRIDVEQMPEGSTYLHRNDRMIDYARMVYAYPKSAREVVRSGTWHTIRQARKRGRRILVAPLDGSEGWIE